MDLVVIHGERQERVRIREVDGAYLVEVGGAEEGDERREYRVDAAEVGPEHHSLLIGNDQYEISIHPQKRGPEKGSRYTLGGADGRISATDGGDLVEVLDPLTHLARESRGGAGAAGRQQVTAYMPGRVVAILVEEGAAVEAGQGVLVLEAMMMENEIQAESSGTLTKLLVEAGQAVDAGDPLFEIGEVEIGQATS
jgi:biotin carboxyl carrier protein